MKLPLPRFTIKAPDGEPSNHQAVHEVHVRELEALVLKYDLVIRAVAMPARPDGTYNRSREACQKLAEEALR